MENDRDIFLRSEEVNEILTATPKWIIRWGISVIFILIVTGISLCYFIRYSDILIADITLTTLNPPITIVSKSEGKLIHLMATNGEKVHPNQIIGVIENTANYKDVVFLHKCADSLMYQLKLNDTLPQVTIREDLKTGELTSNYLLVLKSVKDLNLYKLVNSSAQKVALLKKDLSNYYDLLEKYQKQQIINNEELLLVEKDYNRDTQLFKNGVISARDAETKEKEYLKALAAYEQIRINISSVLIQINSIEKTILQDQIDDCKEINRLKIDLEQNLKALITEINKWERVYLIESPIDGKISFFNVWAVNQNIKLGDELFSVVPKQRQQFIGKCFLPITNSGKLKIGQNVNIKLDNYPYTENGILEGVVCNISEVPNKDKFAIDINLKNGLITSYKKTLFYKEEMRGLAYIITENISVMDRVFFKFRKLIDVR